MEELIWGAEGQEGSLQQFPAPLSAAVGVQAPLSKEGLCFHLTPWSQPWAHPLPLFWPPWRCEMAAAKAGRERGCSGVTLSLHLHLHGAFVTHSPLICLSDCPKLHLSPPALTLSPRSLLPWSCLLWPLPASPAASELANIPTFPALLKALLLYLCGFIIRGCFYFCECCSWRNPGERISCGWGTSAQHSCWALPGSGLGAQGDLSLLSGLRGEEKPSLHRAYLMSKGVRSIKGNSSRSGGIP